VLKAYDYPVTNPLHPRFGFRKRQKVVATRLAPQTVASAPHAEKTAKISRQNIVVLRTATPCKIKPSTATCGKCKQVLPVSDFNLQSSRPNGLQYYCKKCQLHYREERNQKIGIINTHTINKSYSIHHGAHIAERLLSKDEEESNPALTQQIDKNLKICSDCGFPFKPKHKSIKRCNHCNQMRKEKARQEEIVSRICVDCRVEFSFNINCYRRMKDKIPTRCPKCKAKMLQKQHVEKNGVHRLWARGTISSHRSRGHRVNISEDELTEMAKHTNNCQICNIALSYYERSYGNQSPAKMASMDRIRNEKEYSISDVGILCHRCNAIKGDVGFDHLKRIIVGYTSYIRRTEPSFKPL
jgi:hypothetical protein